MSFVVDAGGALTVAPGDQVTLDGTETKPQTGGAFTAPDLTYLWEQVDESGHAVTLTDADKPQASFTVPADQAVYLLEFRLTVTDPNGIFATDEVIILVILLGLPPVVDAPLVGGGVDAGSDSASLEVAISVLDANGDLISSGLTTANFAFQNVMLTPDGGGSPVNVTSATVDRIEIRPPAQGGALTAILDFDSSGSMGSNDRDMSGRKAGGNAFIDLMDGNDDVAILDFGAGSDNGLNASRLLQNFTADQVLLRAALDKLQNAGGTPLWDSGLDAVGLLAQRITTGGILVLLTDGKDTASSNSADALISAAKAQGTRIYTVGLGNNLNFDELKRVAAETGGEFAEATDASELQRVFRGIGTAATKGAIKVFGTLTYPTQSSGRYVVAGELVTTVGGGRVVTPFDFTADIP